MSERPTATWRLTNGWTIGVEDLPGFRKSLALVAQRGGETEAHIVAYFRSDEEAARFIEALT